MAVSTVVRMSLSEYMQYTAPLGFRDELIEGELILSDSPNRRHADVCHQLTRLLERLVDEANFVVRNDVTLILNWDEEAGNRPRPDVFLMDKQRWVNSDLQGGYPEGSPQLTIEVLSPSNTKEEMERKRKMYLGTGAIAVWLVNHVEETIEVYTQSQAPVTYRLRSSVPLPPELGGGAIAVDDIFTGIIR
jgi:Uma2 family endonuclease